MTTDRSKNSHCNTKNERFGALSHGDWERSITTRFAQVVRQCGDRIAIDGVAGAMRYRELDRITDGVAVQILDRLDERSAPVAVLMNQGPAFPIAVLAILKAGKFVVPLDPRSTDGGAMRCLVQSGSQLTLCDDRDRAAVHSGQTMVLSPPFDVGNSKPPAAGNADSYCYIYYTSGSTGEPKGVLDNQRNVLHNIYRYTRTLEIGPNDRLSMIQQPSFSGCVSSMFGALLNGATLCPYDLYTRGMRHLDAWIEQKRITIYHSVPSIFRGLARPARTYRSVRLVRLEGDRVGPPDIDVFRKYFDDGCRLVIGLGSTECGLVRQYFVEHSKATFHADPPLGYAVPDVQAMVVDRNCVEAAAGEIGEIAVRSRFLALGYWQRPDLTGKAFAGNSGDVRLYRTGDLGRMDADGCLHYVSRMDDRVRINGKWIDLSVVEDTVRATGLVRHCVVRPGHDESGPTALTVYYLRSDNETIEPGAFRRVLLPLLPAELVPLYFVDLPAFPLTADGKLAFDLLPPAAAHHRPSGAGRSRSYTRLEASVLGVWQQVLALPDIGLDQNVFEIGADSLLVQRFATRLHDTQGIDLPLHVIFDSPTVRLMARAIAGGAPGHPRIADPAPAPGG